MELILVGLVPGLFYIINMILKARSSNLKPSLFDQLMVLFMLALFSVAVVSNEQAENPNQFITLLIATLGLVFSIISLMTVLLSRGSTGNNGDSRGYLGIGIGLIVLAMAFAVPMLMPIQQASTAPEVLALPTAINDAVRNYSNQRITVSTDRVIAAPTQTPITLNREIPTLQAPIVFFSTPTPTLESMSCEGTITTFANVRSYPTVASGNVLTVAPKDEEVTVLGQTESGKWWFITFGIFEGWVDGELLERTDDCSSLPVRPWS